MVGHRSSVEVVLNVNIVLSATGLPVWRTPSFLSLAVKDVIGYYGDTVTFDVILDLRESNPWEIKNVRDWPEFSYVNLTLTLNNVQYSYSNYIIKSVSGVKVGDKLRVSLIAVRNTVGSDAFALLEAEVRSVLGGSLLEEIREQILAETNTDGMINALRLYGYGVYQEYNKISIYKLESLFKSRFFDRAPISISATAIDVSDFPLMYNISDARIRQDYSGRGLFADVKQSAGPSRRIDSLGNVVEGGTLDTNYPIREVSGNYTNNLHAFSRILGERDVLQYNSESASQSRAIDLRFKPGQRAVHDGLELVTLSATHYVPRMRTELSFIPVSGD